MQLESLVRQSASFCRIAILYGSLAKGDHMGRCWHTGITATTESSLGYRNQRDVMCVLSVTVLAAEPRTCNAPTCSSGAIRGSV